MAKKFRLASSRRAERQKVDQAIKMAAKGGGSPHGRRLDARTVLHREVATPFIPITGPYDPEWAEHPTHKSRRGRHHAPSGKVRSAAASRTSRSLVVRESRPLAKTATSRK